MWLCHKKYLRIQAAANVLQRYYRGYVARKYTQELRRNNAVINLNSRFLYIFTFTDNYNILIFNYLGCAYTINCSNVAMLSSLS